VDDSIKKFFEKTEINTYVIKSEPEIWYSPNFCYIGDNPSFTLICRHQLPSGKLYFGNVPLIEQKQYCKIGELCTIIGWIPSYYSNIPITVPLKFVSDDESYQEDFGEYEFLTNDLNKENEPQKNMKNLEKRNDMNMFETEEGNDMIEDDDY